MLCIFLNEVRIFRSIWKLKHDELQVLVDLKRVAYKKRSNDRETAVVVDYKFTEIREAVVVDYKLLDRIRGFATSELQQTKLQLRHYSTSQRKLKEDVVETKQRR